jgi:hypothetical protein
MVETLHLSPLSPAGMGELRGLYGGGFFAMGLVLLGGLHYRPLAPGLLIAMAIIFAGIVVGRLVSLVLDREFVATPLAGASELLLALACWRIYQQGGTNQAR